MLGHYCALLCHFNRCLVFVITEIFAKWNNIAWTSMDKSNQSTLSLSMNMVIPILNWLCIKYHYHFPIELLIMVIALTIGTISYFYDCFVPGNKCQHYGFTMWTVILFSGNLNWHEIEQWIITIMILDQLIVLLKAIFWLANKSLDERAFPLICSLALGLILVQYCRDYLLKYVDLSKI